MLLLGFLLVIALCLTIWAALTLRTPAHRTEPAEAQPREEPPVDRPSNDQVRGARATVQRPAEGEDAFDRFLRAESDRPRS